MKISNAVLLLASLSSANAETSFLRASVSNDSSLRCLGECADPDVASGKKRTLSKKKIYSSATACASDCVPERNAETIKCANSCFKKQAKDVVKTADKAIEKEIKDCEKKCDDGDDDCEKKCDKKFKNGSKSVIKSVEKKAYKISDSTKKCLAKCIMPPDDVDFDFEEGSDKTDDTEDTKKSTTSEDTTSDDESKCLGKYLKNKTKCEESNKCDWNTKKEKCEDYKKAASEDFDFEEGSDKTDDTEDTKKSTTSEDTTSDDESKCLGKYLKNKTKCEESNKCDWNTKKEKCEDYKKAASEDFEFEEGSEEAVTALA
mmetsp:Transcript_36047/g.73510  ORF Transcript_36047/g.73510 Transcript_36047/m.73510 type:complete len:316 (-) Transcript_36047:175-1122(-)